MIAYRWRTFKAFVVKGQEVHDPRTWKHYVLRNVRNRQPHKTSRIPEDLNRLKDIVPTFCHRKYHNAFRICIIRNDYY